MDAPGRPGIETRYPGRSAGRVLALAFGVLLALMVAAGWDAMATLARLHTSEQAARLDFLSRTEPLIQIRTKLTLYGDLVQKSVVLTTQEPQSGEARDLFSQIRSDLNHYPQARVPEEQALLGKLQTMLADQNRVSQEMLAL